MRQLSKLYQFNLPDELIAQKPMRPRDHARLLVYRLSDGSITDSIFYKLSEFVNPKTTFVLNSSKVEHCRWLFNNSQIELFLLEANDPYTIRALVRPGRMFKLGKKVQLTNWLEASVIGVDDAGVRTIKLSVPHDDARLDPYRHVPLPPYISQDDKLSDDYQTVYAHRLGSKAAPTAGLHFTESLLTQLQGLHSFADITLHVGLGTFAKLTDENIMSGRLHEEYYSITPQATAALRKAEHITAVGTTTVRALESTVREHGQLQSGSSLTDIFIRTGYKFEAIDSMVTNFHLPGTSLLMLVAAFIGDKRSLNEAEAAAEVARIYQHAISNHYRFYSFGDAMILV